MEKPPAEDKTKEQLGTERLVEDEATKALAVPEAAGGSLFHLEKSSDVTAANSSTAPILSRDESVLLQTSVGHRGFTLITFTFALFEVVFLNLFSDKFWFALDLHWLGPLVVLFLYPVAHLLLKWQESENGCNVLSFLWKQKPASVYTKWVTLNDKLFPPGIRFGNKHIGWGAVDELELTLLGNLVFKSNALSGGQRSPADAMVSFSKLERKLMQPQVVLKIPFGVAAREEQLRLIQSIKLNKPGVVFNSRLEKSLNAPQVKGAAMIPLFGAVFLFLVLLDVGYSTFAYLESLKGYYLAQTEAIAGNKSKAEEDFAHAEDIQSHPLPISWVTPKMMSQKPVATPLYQAKAEALWHLGRREEAVQTSLLALKIAPKSFRINMQIARMYYDMGKLDLAAKQLDEAMENHKDTFLPQMYMVAVKQTSPVKIDPAARAEYVKQKAKLDEETFADEPHWPPGGNRFLHDIWFREDVEFVLNKLIGIPRN